MIIPQVNLFTILDLEGNARQYYSLGKYFFTIQPKEEYSLRSSMWKIRQYCTLGEHFLGFPPKERFSLRSSIYKEVLTTIIPLVNILSELPPQEQYSVRS